MSGNHIIIGIGGTGGNILKSIRKRLFQETPADERNGLPLEFIYIDSSMEHMQPDDPSWKVLGENALLGKDSFLFLRGTSLDNQLENKGIKGWIGNREIWEKATTFLLPQTATRRLGRFLFACSVNEYERMLKKQVAEVRNKSLRSDVTFHIIAGLAGGTGSGAIVDVIAQTRKHFRQIPGAVNHKILVYGFVPEQFPLQGRNAEYYHANGYAALKELNALQTGRYIPRDVTGEYEFVPLEDDSLVFDSCFLFTNINENGQIFNTKADLPDMVSDFIYHFLTFPANDISCAFRRVYLLDDCCDYAHENDENAKTSETASREKPVRTRRFNAFGTKRIIHPEEEIVEYLTYNFARQSLLQMKYNNWADDRGYRDQPKNEDYISFVKDSTTLNNWMISDAHLMLSLPILPWDKERKWKTIQDDWNAVFPNLADEAWSKDQNSSINELVRICEERFEKHFRTMGVSEFYKIKEQTRKEIAREICYTIQCDLFSRWQNGEISIHEISSLMDALIAQTEIRLKTFDEKMFSRSGEIDKMYNVKTQNEHDWANLSIVAVALGKNKKLFRSQSDLLQHLYIRKTELEGLRFAKKLLAETLNEMQLLYIEVMRFSDMLSDVLQLTEKEIAERCREEQFSAESFAQTVVKYYDSYEVKKFTDRIIRDQQIQAASSSSTRHAIIALAGCYEKSFRRLNDYSNVDSLMDIFATHTRESVIQAHHELITDQTLKLIGVNIIEKLKKQYGDSDKQAELYEFVRNLLMRSGVFLTFDNAEVFKHLKNNNPPCPGKDFMLKSTLICIPESPENQDFVNKLTDAFKQISGGGRNIYIDAKSQRKNEITMIQMTSCFPLRTVNEVKYLKEKYDWSVNGNNQEIARWALHSESFEKPLPDLYEYTKTKIEVEEERIPIMILVYAMNLLTEKQDAATGETYKAIGFLDEFGMIGNWVNMGKNFIESVERLVTNDSVIYKIEDLVAEKLKDEYQTDEKRVSLKNAVAELVNNHFLPLFGNNELDENFMRYKRAAAALIKNNLSI